MTIQTLEEHFSLVVEGHKFETCDIWNIVVAACANGHALDCAANQLEDGPSPSLVRLYLREGLVFETTLDARFESCNDALVAQLPPRIIGKSRVVQI